jgi:hypothetical protein
LFVAYLCCMFVLAFVCFSLFVLFSLLSSCFISLVFSLSLLWLCCSCLYCWVAVSSRGSLCFNLIVLLSILIVLLSYLVCLFTCFSLFFLFLV